ncbi:MAG: hypothetical protein CMJ49_03285 [Planctomycetaceae bacterium]|nr:hypothetical protein [Planctomycetaceae bacterium]
MAKKMMQLMDVGKFAMAEFPIDTPGPGQVALEVEAVTTCPQWDMHLWRGEPMFPGMELTYPFTPGAPGHETVGRVAQVGPGVTSLKVEQRVAAWRALPMDRHGTYGTHVLHDVDRLLPIPEGDPAAAWAPLELAMCVATTMLDLRDHGFLPCRRIGISGLGPGGLIACQMAGAMGVQEVIGFDPDDRRREFAAGHGWAEPMDPSAANANMNRGKPDAMDVSIDCVGSAKVIAFLSDHTNDVVAIFGVQREDYAFKPRHGVAPALRLWGYPGHHLAGARFAHGLVRENSLDLQSLCTHCVPLRQYDQAVSLLLSKEAIKVCLLCDAPNV